MKKRPSVGEMIAAYTTGNRIRTSSEDRCRPCRRNETEWPGQGHGAGIGAAAEVVFDIGATADGSSRVRIIVEDHARIGSKTVILSLIA